MSRADALEKFNRIRLRRIEIDDQQDRTRFDGTRLRLGKRVDRDHAVTRREFLQRRRNSGGERIVFFDEKNARRCPGRRFFRSRHGGSERKGREEEVGKACQSKVAQVACLCAAAAALACSKRSASIGSSDAARYAG